MIYLINKYFGLKIRSFQTTITTNMKIFSLKQAVKIKIIYWRPQVSASPMVNLFKIDHKSTCSNSGRSLSVSFLITHKWDFILKLKLSYKNVVDNDKSLPSVHVCDTCVFSYSTSHNWTWRDLVVNINQALGFRFQRSRMLFIKANLKFKPVCFI